MSYMDFMGILRQNPSLGKNFLHFYLRAISSSKMLGHVASDKKEFRSDGAVPPRCLVHLFLRRLGVKHLRALFWSDKDVRNLFEG